MQVGREGRHSNFESSNAFSGFGGFGGFGFHRSVMPSLLNLRWFFIIRPFGSIFGPSSATSYMHKTNKEKGIRTEELNSDDEGGNNSNLDQPRTLIHLKEEQECDLQERPLPTKASENAKKAYLLAIKMGKRGREPDVAEFISALAAGNNAKLMVVACAGTADSTVLGLAAAARQTRGRVVCISSGEKELQNSRKALGVHGHGVEFVVGDAKRLLIDDYKGADFVLVDCGLNLDKEIFLAAFKGVNCDGALVVGYNVGHSGSRWRQLKASFLPIGEGLLVTKIDPKAKIQGGVEQRKKSHWIVEVDKCTGEEHIFRISSSSRKVQIQA
ncbi:hypothetical protein L6164_003692 [Bauhinia variegata]|uniref:Uncharacterized protein n=1 Tax=Bauhinia variegata TaxID=167791 RepID=A0ACB9Q229_BAUVA|nr:hypothetical protein L6164_003692 [Bauhinia variegata]